MCSKTDKRRLYWLVDMYLSNNINVSTFCDEFYYCYGQELDREKELSETEKRVFGELSEVSGRFSPYEADHKLDAKAFVDEEQLKKEIVKAIGYLDGNVSNKSI